MEPFISRRRRVKRLRSEPRQRRFWVRSARTSAGGTTYGQAWPFSVLDISSTTIKNAAKANANRCSVWIGEAQPDTLHRILVDANIKYAVSAYPDSCGYRCDFG